MDEEDHIELDSEGEVESHPPDPDDLDARYGPLHDRIHELFGEIREARSGPPVFRPSLPELGMYGSFLPVYKRGPSLLDSPPQTPPSQMPTPQTPPPQIPPIVLPRSRPLEGQQMERGRRRRRISNNGLPAAPERNANAAGNRRHTQMERQINDACSHYSG
ncbi:unnamed protein product [Calypogeia fissa]